MRDQIGNADALKGTAIHKCSIADMGVHAVRVIEGIREHENRYHFIIEIDMEKEALPAYNVSRCHHEWKEKYGSRIEKKAIFDYE